MRSFRFSNMKWFGVFVSVFILALNYISQGAPALSPSGVEQTMKMMKNLCKRSHPVKQEYLNRVKEEGVFVDDPKFKCYIHCTLGMMKVIRKNRITPVEATKQAEALLPEPKKSIALKQLNSCKDIQGSDGCDVAYNFAKCAYETAPTNIPIPV